MLPLSRAVRKNTKRGGFLLWIKWASIYYSTLSYCDNLTKNELEIFSSLSDKINSEQRREISPKKKRAMIGATNARIQKAKAKIENAINILRMENRPITIYSVSKESGVSYNTAVKYSELINSA